jgi:hypothetical protein
VRNARAFEHVFVDPTLRRRLTFSTAGEINMAFDDVIELAMTPAIESAARGILAAGETVSVVRQAKPKGIGIMVGKLYPETARFDTGFSFILFEETGDEALTRVTWKTPATKDPKSDECPPAADTVAQLLQNFVLNLK